MDKTEQKIVQYLSEAHATEKALVTVLQSQIAMTPGGSYRDGLESHLRETREHATRVQRRLDELGQGSSPIQAGVGLVQSVVGQALALGKTPLDLVRGTFDLIILKTLSWGPMHGLGVLRWIERTTEQRLQIEIPSVVDVVLRDRLSLQVGAGGHSGTVRGHKEVLVVLPGDGNEPIEFNFTMHYILRRIR